jgi:hypothetical protein
MTGYWNYGPDECEDIVIEDYDRPSPMTEDVEQWNLAHTDDRIDRSQPLTYDNMFQRHWVVDTGGGS